MMTSSSYLELSVGVPNLVDIGQRTTIVRRTSLRQTELLDLLELHLMDTSKQMSHVKNHYCLEY